MCKENITEHSSLGVGRDLSNHTPNELVRLVLDDGSHSAQALEELRERALHAPFPFKPRRLSAWRYYDAYLPGVDDADY